jgi:two-component system, LytTR family, response regulator
MPITKGMTMDLPPLSQFDRRARTPVGPVTEETPGQHARRLLVVDSQRTIIVRTEEVELLRSAANYVELSLPGASHLLRATLSEVERRLDPARFMRVHRCAIVNVTAVLEIDRAACPWELVLRNGQRQAVARSRREQILAWLAGDSSGEEDVRKTLNERSEVVARGASL